MYSESLITQVVSGLPTTRVSKVMWLFITNATAKHINDFFFRWTTFNIGENSDIAEVELGVSDMIFVDEAMHIRANKLIIGCHTKSTIQIVLHD